MKRRVTEILHELNIPPHVRGYEYLREAILLCIANPQLMHQITKMLYPQIAAKYNSTGSKVERAIRHAITRGFESAPILTVRKYFNLPKVTNGEFIATIADMVRLEQEEFMEEQRKLRQVMDGVSVMEEVKGVWHGQAI